MRQSSRFWALSFALVVLALELGAQSALAAGEKQSKGAKTRAPKIRRTVRVKEAVPAPAQVAAPVEPTIPKIEMTNLGSTNKVDVQPSITIAAPPAAAPALDRAAQMQIVPYQPKQVVPIVEEPDEEEEQQQQQQEQGKQEEQQVASGNANKLALVNSNNNLELATLGSNNRHAHTMGNSNNQLVELAEGNGNHKQTIVRNSGNTEQVHIDGVGNNKVTRITNAGNSEQQLAVEPRPLAVSGHPVAPLAPTAMPFATPLVQINMNDVLERARGPPAPEKTTTLIQPVIYGLPQSPQVPSVPLEALSASQRQAVEIAGSPAGLMSPSTIRQMAPSPHNFWSALQQIQPQQPLVMVMPAQQQPQLLQSPYGPAPMIMVPMFYPYQSPMVVAPPSAPFVDHHRVDHHVRKLGRKLHKMRVADKIRRAERRARREADRAHRDRANSAPTKPTVIVVNHDKQPSTTPAPPVTTTPAPKVVVITKEATREPQKKVVVEAPPKVAEDDEDEEEEVIEWETVRVPKRRMKSKKSATTTK